MRTAYQFHHLSDVAKLRAEKEQKGMLLTQFLYNEDGSKFEISTTVHLYEKKSKSIVESEK